MEWHQDWAFYPHTNDDVLADARYGHTPPHYGMPAGHLPVTSYLAVPVVSRSGEVIGGLFFGHPEPGVFRAEAPGIDGALSFSGFRKVSRARAW